MSSIKYPIGGFAPGIYMSACVSCGQDFVGDKYANQCEPCAINTVNEKSIQATAKLNRLMAAIQNMESGLGVFSEMIEQLKEERQEIEREVKDGN